MSTNDIFNKFLEIFLYEKSFFFTVYGNIQFANNSFQNYFFKTYTKMIPHM